MAVVVNPGLDRSGIMGQAGAVPIGSGISIKHGPHSKPTFAVFVDPGPSVTSTPQPSSSAPSLMVHQPSSVPPTSAFQPPVPRQPSAYISESREQVEENLERWRFALERRGMKVSRSKTEYMCVNEREGSGTVRLQGEEVKKVQEFKYLGSTVQSNGECGKEGAGGNWATVGRRSRGGRRVRRQREKRKGKGRELADMMERRKVDILCVQETRWKGSKARSIGAGFKVFYYGVDSKRNGVGVVLKEEFVRNVLEVGCELEEKERFWSELDEVMESIPTGERVVIGADFNGHVGEGNTGDEEVMEEGGA
ncbi:hypothetical protein QTP70_001117 [Hemibagrus guttatus]|uniref:Endonuclease/exonuclease/phosphatase domain-containing protein n=1 Tax=Hemibagrus guttatus TaxID=175788 RepID=A0AAE0Q245_9TELE|nr:hypothetical protein QTP70_001117 [Hemibagrus guttatus]